MQPSQQLTVQRRALDIEDYIDILRRHRGWVLGPFLFVLVVSVVGVYLWPDSYRSEATIQIRPQQIPEQMIAAAINQDIIDSINQMANSILSRSKLTQIIRNYELYPDEQTRMPLEDVIELMRRNISIQPLATLTGTSRTGQFPAFMVSFTYSDRLTASKVVGELATQFIDENVTVRTRQSYQTSEFIQSQADMAKQQLDEADRKLTEFRVENNGHLPDQLNSNMQQLSATSQRATTIIASLNRAEQEKLQLESQLNIIRDELAARSKEAEVVAEVRSTQSPRILQEERVITQAEDRLAVVLQQYTENHPDVRALQEQLEVARQRLETIRAEEAAAAAKAQNTVAPADLAVQRDLRGLDASIRQVETAIERKNSEISLLEQDLARTNNQVNQFQARVTAIPVGESEYDQLIRDRQMAQDNYLNWTQRLASVDVARQMEDRQQGETLQILDPASVPSEPTEPDRPLVIAMGAALGLVLGIVVAGAREMKDTSLKNLKDVRAYTQMAILGSVPLLENDFVVRRRRRIAWLGWTTACLVSVVTMAGSVAYYYLTHQVNLSQ